MTKAMTTDRLFKSPGHKPGQLIEWCESLLLKHHLQWHNDPADEYCLYLHTTYVFGHDIKDMWAIVQFNLLLQHCIYLMLRVPWKQDGALS
jgi:hypothetical protein